MNNNTFQYNGTDITFLSGNKEVMVNATEMSKTFGKQPSDWTKTKSAQDFIDSLSAVRKICRTDLIRVLQGGNMQGTWMHEDVALEFARWLSPAFAIWCNDRIKELMRYGMTATQPTLEAMVDNPDLVIGLARKLKEERAEKQRLIELNESTQKQLEQQAPKVLFADSVSASHTSILIGDLAKILKQNGVEIGAKRLFMWMRKNGYLIKQPGMSYNMPSQRGMNLNLFEIKETVVTHSDGHTSINKTVKVTGTGQIYFVNKFLSQKQPAYEDYNR